MPASSEVLAISRWPRRASLLARAGLLALVVILLLEGRYVLLGRNFHVLRPSLVYRCAQQNGPQLAELIHKHQIRTVINLRGCNLLEPWYAEECRVTHGLDVCQEDICLSAGRLPSATELRRLIDVLEHAEYPVLFHCRRGADRTGLVAAMVLLLQTDATLADARWQLGPRFGHVAIGRPAYLDQLFDQYAAWLNERGFAHDSALFREWVVRDYLPAGYRAELALLDRPAVVVPGRPAAVRLRALNTGTSKWSFRPESNAGVHLRSVLHDRNGAEITKSRSGLFRADVAPGQSIDLTLALPGLAPGGYRLFVDLMDEQHLCFFQGGSEPWEWEFEVRDQAAATAGERHPAGLPGVAH